MNATNRNHQMALRKSVNYVSVALVAGLLMMWGTMNFVTNVADFMQGESERRWWLAGLFSIVTVAVPFGLGVWLIVRLMNPNRNKKKVSC